MAMQSAFSSAELARLIETIAGPDDTAQITYQAVSWLWRGAYGPFMIISGRFKRGGDFEFAVRIDQDPIDLSRNADDGNARDIYFID